MGTYKIIRFYNTGSAYKSNEIIKQGVTLEQARAHCKDPATSTDTWFDGYEKEREHCVDCGSEFEADGGEDTCDPCKYDHALYEDDMDFY